MSLEITILKQRHETEEDAKKLRSFIESCDIYGVENAGCSVADAIRIEEDWKVALTFNRSKFRRWREETYGSNCNRNYLIKRDDDLYLNQKPIWFSERFKEEDSKRLRKELVELIVRENNLFNNLANGIIDDFLSPCIDNLSKIFDFNISRDKNIAENILAAEEDFRTRYDSFCKSRETIKLSIGIGGLHRPEDYLPIAPHIVNLEELPVNARLQCKMYYIWKNGEKINQRDCLAYGLASLQKGGKIKSSLSANDLLSGMKFEELTYRLKIGISQNNLK